MSGRETRDGSATRQEARSLAHLARDMAGQMLCQARRHPVITASALAVLALLAIYYGVYYWARIPPAQRLPPAARAEAMALLATARDTDAPLPDDPRHEALQRRVPGPVFVRLYHRGKAPFEYRSAVPTRIWDALRAAAEQVRQTEAVTGLPDREKRQTRFKVDVAQGRGPIVTFPEILHAISLIPGVDGLGVRAGGKTAYLDPEELLRRGLVTGYQPFKFVKEFKAGLHIRDADELLARQLGLWEDGKWKDVDKTYFRFRTAGFVEAPFDEKAGKRGPPLPVYRGNTPPPELDRKAVIDACVAGGNYILRQLMRRRAQVPMRYALKPNTQTKLHTHILAPGWTTRTVYRRLAYGQFKYIYYPLTDNYQAAGYSLPRHSGTTFALALLYGKLKGREGVSDAQIRKFKEGAEIAIKYLGNMVERGRCKDSARDYVCVARGHQTDLGSSALTLVGIMEYQRQTGDTRYRDLARRLANFLVYMQRDDGEFCHRYDVAAHQRKCKDKLLYYSGEAALALAMAYKLLGDERYKKATEKALDYLTGENYWPLPMKFLFGEDHWTCIAAEEAWPALKKDRYAEFCYEFARFQRRHQFDASDHFADYEGGYGITPFFPPHLTPAGSRTEAMVSTYDLSRHRGETSGTIAAQIVRAFKYIVRHQVRRENAYLFARPKYTVGAIRKSPIKYDVRIDYVQHTVAAMVRALDLVPKK